MDSMISLRLTAFQSEIVHGSSPSYPDLMWLTSTEEGTLISTSPTPSTSAIIVFPPRTASESPIPKVRSKAFTRNCTELDAPDNESLTEFRSEIVLASWNAEIADSISDRSE